MRCPTGGVARRNGLQVLVVDSVLLHRLLQSLPVVLVGDANACIGEDLADLSVAGSHTCSVYLSKNSPLV
jgi:hypothetical protein